MTAHLERVAKELAHDFLTEQKSVAHCLCSDCRPNLEADLAKFVAAALAACAREEREACIQDIQDAIGDWGGPERKHYTPAMQRAIAAIEKRAKGLDLWGRALERAVGEKASLDPK